MTEEHTTEHGYKITFDLRYTSIMSHADQNKCVIATNGLLFIITTPYLTMKAKKEVL